MNTTKGLYVGAGIDIKPYISFPDIKLWISIDGQPNSEFGDYTGPGLERPNFIRKLDKKLFSAGYKINKVEGNIREYQKNDQIIRYHTNTPLPSSFNNLNNDICKDSMGWNLIYVAGHDPRDCILKTAAEKLIFVGSEGTWYKMDENDREYNEELCARFYDKIHLDRFTEFWYRTDEKIYKFKTWEEFMKCWISML